MASIPIVNHSFEDPVLAPGGATSGPGSVPGWTQSSPNLGMYHPVPGTMPPNPDGSNQLAWMLEGSITQSTGHTFQPGVLYTVSVDCFTRSAGETPFGGCYVEILIGETVIARNTIASGSAELAPGTVKTCHVQVVAPPGVLPVGNVAVRIGILESGSLGSWVTDIDNVRLEASPTFPFHVNNPSFEMPPVAPGTDSGAATDTIFFWATNGYAGVWRPLPEALTPRHGVQVGFLAAGTISQQVFGGTLTADTQYMVSADFLARLDAPPYDWPGSELALLAGSTVLATAVIPAGSAALPNGLPPGQITTAQATY